MADLVAVLGCPHAPPIARDWDTLKDPATSGMGHAFAELGRRIAAKRPDVIVVIGADHWANFFLDNMPGIALGVGAQHSGPPEPWLDGYPHTTMTGHPDLAMHLADTVYAAGFEPSLSYRMKLDHAFCVPLWKSGLDPLPAIVPLVINALQPPLPTMARCLHLGAVLAEGIANYPGDLRVVILASGGLSHSVGERAMGRVDEAFDHECAALLTQGEPDRLLAFLTDARVAEAGNGSAELRFWVAAHGAAGCRGFSMFHYEVPPRTFTGCGFGEWELAPESVETR